MTSTKLRNQRIVGMNIVLNGHRRSVPSLGPNLEMKDCDIALEHPDLVIGGFTMDGGCFDAKKGLEKMNFYGVVFDGVRFAGRFSNCTFGCPPDLRRFHQGAVHKCDFSRAMLSDCMFACVDVEKCVFAGWPTVLVLEPRRHAAELENLVSPGNWAVVLRSLMQSPEWCSAVVIDIDYLREEFGGGCQELRDMVSAQSFMRTSFHS